MKVVRVKTSKKTYPILVGPGLLNRAETLLKRLHFTGRVLIVTQRKIKPHLHRLVQGLGNLRSKVHYVPDGETAKSEKELFRLYHTLVREGVERQGLILGLGGGVVGDLTGFAAATYLRGIRFVNVGTTLLAQVDSSIGGKTGINLSEGKNLVGAFYQPEMVISDIDTLETLAVWELTASLAEVVKYGVIKSPRLFIFLEENAKKILSKDAHGLERIVYESSQIKAAVISRDEFETQGERMILNFGHTFGHGFEQAANFKALLHGEAISVGMVCATRLAVLTKMLSPREEKRILDLLKRLRLPTRLPRGLKTEKILVAMSRDKKKSAGSLRFILPVRIGKVRIKEGVPPRLIRRVIEEVGGQS